MLDFLKKIKDRGLPFLVLTIVVGFLSTWIILFKVAKPITRSICNVILQDDLLENASEKQERVKVVQAETVTLGTMSKRINTVGRLRANAMVVIKSEMSGRIVEIPFVEGGEVKEGDVLVKFDDSDLQAELKQAEGELMLRQADFERINTLHGQKIESVKKMDEARASLTISQGKVESAKAKLAKTVIKAPFSGKIGLIDVSKGAFIQAGQELVTLVDTTSVKVDFKVPEKFVNEVGVGQVADIKVGAFKEQNFQATVEAVDSKVEAESHSISVRATIPNEDNVLKPGLFANVSLIIGEKGQTVQVDEMAVDREGEIEFVWIVNRGTADRVRVLTGARENGKIEIVAGLQEGQIVVTDGQFKLSPGCKVKINNFEKTPDDATSEETSKQESSTTESSEKSDSKEKGSESKNTKHSDQNNKL
jgi:membrane fusion protein (multidrug efflux system)